ncbi:hypothetical protein GCM10011515_06850 [Tsuneonella deserti]|uniref:DUF6285 domain-containing protein n=1 Tax=Tsuneonella deserti TaxID=2035528 RepID=A0ABQ1S165_9SPHN|nr:DUF6285 domain-containing protein [Tsuneonella deserti]GGD89855.1 hypothetical protein GCM10011515_06850 [Tsuneonella deserti]
MFDRPSPSLLIAEARRALEGGVAPGFPQKVVANALGIAQRQLEMGPALEEEERTRLVDLLGPEEDLASLNGRLAVAIRSASIDAEEPALINHLIRTTVAKLEIDQPAYPAFRAWRGSKPDQA